MARLPLKIAVLFGGRSSEHEISLLSASNIIQGLDSDKYELLAIGITRQGQWVLIERDKWKSGHFFRNRTAVTERDGSPLYIAPGQAQPFIKQLGMQPLAVDLIFPILHGPYGEDGSLQGLLKLLNRPFVGADILASAVGMDKDAMKRLLTEQGIAVAEWITLHRGAEGSSHPDRIAKLEIAEIAEMADKIAGLGETLYVKPASQGSSVGVSRTRSPAELQQAIHLAFRYDRKVIVERAIAGRELECAILGNSDPQASPIIGEIIAKDQFYSYSIKYKHPQGARLIIPASLTEQQRALLCQQALKSYRALGLNGLARVDMFLVQEQPREKVYVNEVNTMPGFTNISMYPKLWEANGLPLPQLLDQLVELAIEWHRQQEELRIVPHP